MESTRMEMRILRIRGERIIIAALIVILAAEVSKTIWPLATTDSETANAVRNFIAQKNSPKNMLIDALDLYGYFLLTISLIATGIRCLRKKWTSIKGIAMVLIGLCLCLYHLAEIEIYKSIGKGLDDIKRPNFEIIKFRAEQESLPLNTRSKLSKMYAHEKYLHEGKIVEYTSETGESKAYEPTNDDIKFRNVANNAREIWDINNRRLPRLFQWWVAVGIVGFVFGIFTPIRKVAPNTRSDHDRA
jgi:hypothetical protein